ncbi:Mini-ribonuclease 3 [Sporolactobacillus terrae]|uniref:Mini-ribonuclease 3 n=1 Tax=Sporolactobacillus terrae TaxID=269673 RepID=A0A410D587_9BACL|nr:Mini-ribonuclease 3 [Sporolactobacillus terrae]QAA21253.1 ribonuclease III [Sporolactobacillus terrae]QAA24225.1 ribonuclease III [Sporolactobacillus terrae]UAK16033.1 Mini-ribonuclease 3 [Sporolactobacillus terrae]BBN97393.1 mini-ribonuclease 3 [Sporolactobacillus terrae]
MKVGQSKTDPKQLNSLALAYMGDAVIEVYVRKMLIDESGKTKPHALHAQAVDYVSAKAQCRFLHELMDEGFLMDDECNTVRRGRNAKSHSVPRNTDVQTYNFSTGFEALIGTLFLEGKQERIDAIMGKMFEYHPVEGSGQNE